MNEWMTLCNWTSAHEGYAQSYAMHAVSQKQPVLHDGAVYLQLRLLPHIKH